MDTNRLTLYDIRVRDSYYLSQLHLKGGLVMQSVPDCDVLCGYDFTLPDATHKQDDRAYVQLVRDTDPTSKTGTVWQYSMRKPEGVEGKDFETMIDADEAFAVVQRRNGILRV